MRLPSFLWLTRRHIPLWLVLLVGTLLSSVVFQIKQEAISERQRAVLGEFSNEHVRRFQWELDVHIDALQSLRQFMLASAHTDREAFRSYAQGTMSRTFALRALQWIPAVAADEREAFERRAVEEGMDEFVLYQNDETGRPKPAEPAEWYYPILYEERNPDFPGRPGFDLGSTAAYYEVLQGAERDGNQVVAMPPKIVNGQGGEFEVVLFLPVFLLDREDRKLSGFVSATLDVAAIWTRVFHFGGDGVRVELWDEDGGDGQPVSLFSTGAIRTGELASQSGIPVSVGSHDWSLRIAAGKGALNPGAATEGWSVLGIGLVFTGFVALWMRQRQGYVSSVEAEVGERTAALSRMNANLQIEMVQRQEVEARLMQSEARFREAFLHAPIGIALLSPSGVWMQVNEALVRMTGMSEEELQQCTISDLLHPDEVQEELARMGQLLAGEIGPFALEQRFRHVSGDFFWVLLNVSRVRDERGQLLYFICQILDITERKRALEEVREARASLQVTTEMLTQRNRELQDFAYVASHDLQEPLRKIRAFGDRLMQKCEGELDEQATDYLARMQDAARRMQTLISDLLAFSRISTEAHPFVPVDLKKIVKEVLSDLETRVDEVGAEIEVGSLPTVEADATQMRQLLQNLVSNGLKYHCVDRPCRLRIYATEGSGDEGIPGLSGPGCQVHIEDNGIGFDEKYLDRIFTVFQRLHGRSEYQGTGVGLAICRRIVERHHGWITARSQPGEGSTFTVALPYRQGNPIM